MGSTWQQCQEENGVNCWNLQTGQSAAKPQTEEGSTTIPKGSRIKRFEAQGTPNG